jgi:very-short-patch-repair endonuclease
MERRRRLDRAIRGKSAYVGQLVAELARRQHGAVARRQLLAMGIGPDVIDRWIAAGRLHVIHRGVYAVGHVRFTQKGRWMAAVLACGEDALLSHRSAIALWDLLPTQASSLDVTLPAGSGRKRRRGILLHRTSSLDAVDATVIDGIPVTALPRTLLDFAGMATADRLSRAIERADQRDPLDIRAMESLLSRCANHPGRRRLATALENYRPTQHLFRSPMEKRFYDACRDADLPPPEMNTWVGEYEVDACWPQYGLAVELDSRTWHETRAAFERDRRRDRALQLAGLRAVRFTERDVRAIGEVIDTVTRLLVLGGYARRASG